MVMMDKQVLWVSGQPMAVDDRAMLLGLSISVLLE